MNNKNLTVRDKLLEVMLDKRRTCSSQPTAQRIKTSCSGDVPPTSNRLFTRCLSLHRQNKRHSVHKCPRLSLSTWDSFAMGSRGANDHAVSSRGSTASACHGHVLITLSLSPVKNALLELALRECAKHLIRKRKLGAVFISGAFGGERLGKSAQHSQENPSEGSQEAKRSRIGKKVAEQGRWKKLSNAHASLAVTSIEYSR